MCVVRGIFSAPFFVFGKGVEHMNGEAAKFAAYLRRQNVDSFKAEELHDEHDSVIFRSSLILHGQSIPLGIIIDDTVFAIIRVNIAVHAVTDENYQELFHLIMRLNNKSKLFKYYLTPDLSVILDACVPFEKDNLSCELLYKLVAVTAKEIESHYREFIKPLFAELAEPAEPKA